MIVRYPELQSGFLAYPTEQGVRRPESPGLSPVQMILPPKLSRSNQEFFFSPEVELLVDVAVNDVLETRSLAYHARVMQAAGVLFDKKPFQNWMRIQEQSKRLSSEHKQFLIDTLKAVNGSGSRVFEPRVWSTMISAANEPNVKPFRATDVLLSANNVGDVDLSTFLAQWVDLLGIGDLVTSLQVIFGRRTLHASQGAHRY